MSYVPNPSDPTEPVASRTVESAAREFREIKGLLARSLSFPAADTPTNRGLLPRAADRAGRVLQFNPTTGVPEAGPFFPIPVNSVDSQFALYRAAGAGAVATNVQSKLRESRSVLDFGVTSTGDQHARYQTACDALGADGGGVLHVPNGINSVIDGILNVPDNVILEYDGGVVGHINPSLIPARSGQLILPQGAQIRLNNASGLRGFSIIRSGTSFNSTSAQIATWVNNGDAIVLNNNTTDALIENCGIFGFNQAIRTVVGAVNVSRTRLNRLQIDCRSGISISRAYDIPYINEVHCWPFCSVNAPAEPQSQHLLRAGTAFFFGEVNDWAKVTNCFSYGYHVGFGIQGGDNITLVSCGADNVPGQTNSGSIGFHIVADAREPTLIACQAAAQTHGFYINSTSVYSTVAMIGCSSWECDTSHIVIERGRAVIQGHRARSGPSGIIIHPTAEKATLLGNDFAFLSVAIHQVGATTKVYEAANTYTNVQQPKLGAYTPTVVASDPLQLDGESTAFVVTGAVPFGGVSNLAVYAGKLITLMFANAVVLHSGGSMLLAGGVNFNATANDTIQFYCDGARLYETSRSVN